MPGKVVPESPKISSGRSLIIEWANQQDHWLRAMISELLQSQTALTDEQIDLFYSKLLIEKELEPGEKAVVLPLEDKNSGPDAEEAVTLAHLKDVENVNALAPGQQLSFNPRLTVIFGENAAGKSGYARILKGLAAVRTAESILCDINKPPAGPKATIGYWLGSEVGDTSKAKTLTWTGQKGVAPLTRMDVFDSRGVSIHVDDELSYVYTPSDLSLFPLISNSIEKIKAKLDKARVEITGPGNQFTNAFNRQGPLYSKIETLGASTNVEELKKLADVSPEEKDALSAIESQVDALRADNNDAALAVAQSEKQWLASVIKNAESLVKVNLHTLNSAMSTLRQARDSYRKTSELAFAEESIRGLASQAWTGFIEAGETYMRENYKDYPTESDSCVYCHQLLSADAVALIKKYRDYCSTEAKKTMTAAQSSVQITAAPLLQPDLARLIEDATEKLTSDTTNKAWIESIIEAARIALTAREVFESESEVPTDSLGAWATILSTAIERLTKLDASIAELQTKGAQKKQAFEDELKKLLLLKDRLQLLNVLASVLAYVEKAKWADRANSVLSKFRALSTSLTGISKIASEQLMNQDFQKLFLAECEALKAPSVSLDFKGRQAQTSRKKTISTHKLSDVLSEGEQKVIALADFIAESSLRQKSSPIVLDDPVNSLDYKRLKHVVERIYGLSQTRQIIIFTHNIWFATELLERFRKTSGACSYFDIQSEGQTRGLISPASNPRTDSFNDYKKRINEFIKQAEKAENTEVREALVKSAYDYMRGACEVIVENDLFQEVTKRYRANVMMTKLVEIKADRLPAAIKVINEVFDKCCDMMPGHSHGLETLNVRPSLDELKTEWSSLQTARAAYIA